MKIYYASRYQTHINKGRDEERAIILGVFFFITFDGISYHFLLKGKGTKYHPQFVKPS
jgi:hypothetical protein